MASLVSVNFARLPEDHPLVVVCKAFSMLSAIIVFCDPSRTGACCVGINIG